jgi:YbbR domain-containing protein
MNNKINIIILSIVFSFIIWISITLSDLFFTSYNFNVKVVDFPNGYTSGDISAQNLSVKLKAEGWQLITLNLAGQLDYYISANKDSGRIVVDPFNDIMENSWITSGISVVDITPRNLEFNVERIIAKKVKVEADIDISYKDGYDLATPVFIYPDSVLVYGPKNVIDNTSSIKTKLVEIKDVDKQEVLVIEFEKNSGFDTDQHYVQLKLNVQRIVEKTIDNIKVVINDIPKDRDVVLIPNNISCSLRGGINILGKIGPGDVTASLDYKDIILDTLESVLPRVTIPKHTQLVFTKPERLKYIIKKFE